MMKKNNILLLIFCFYCFKSQNDTIIGLQLVVKNEKIYSYKDSVEYELINDSKDTYILYLDVLNFKKDSVDSEIYFIQLQPTYVIYNDKNSIESYDFYGIHSEDLHKKEYAFWDNKNKFDSIYYNDNKKKYKNYNKEWILNQKYYRENKIIIFPMQKVRIKTLIQINQDLRIYSPWSSYYLLKKESNYWFQQIIKQDSNKIKKYLSFQELSSLKKSNIKIFHGEIKSNKVPIIVDEKDLF